MAASPVVLVVCAAIGVASLVVYLRWRASWSRAGLPGPPRRRELGVLVIATLAALALVVSVSALLHERATRARMQAELQERAALAATLRASIDAELDTARALLAEQAIEKIAQDRLAQARAELARFAQFQDPKILRMIELIDKELAIRESLRQGQAQVARP